MRAFLFLPLLGAAPVSGIAVDRFGTTTDGQAVARVVLANDRGMRVALVGWGATITAIEVPGRDGSVRNVALSLPTLADFERTERRWGGVVGRYAGRIADASFVLDGVRHRLEPGRNGVTLHGGGVGWDRRPWRVRTERDARSVTAVMTLLSPAGDQGFPGAVTVEVAYRLSRRADELRVDYRATTTAPTPFNPTNHLFVNLAGAGQGTVAAHRLRLFADRYAETDARKIPTGRLLPVAGTPLDFRRVRPIGGSYDHGFVLRDRPSARPRPAALLHDPTSGRRLLIATTEPSLQLNTGPGLDGLALETQHLSDSPNRPAFPSTILRPGRPFRSTTIYRFDRD